MQRVIRLLGVVFSCSGLLACGGGGSPAAPTQAAPPPAPSVAITAVGAGALVLHPSLNPTFTFAMETPIRITETGGGSADWAFARLSLFRGGAEVERAEIGSNVIQAAGFGRINARSEGVRNVLFRFNSDQFDRVDITLGFVDIKDARQFSVQVAGNTFSDVTVSLTPLALIRSQSPM